MFLGRYQEEPVLFTSEVGSVESFPRQRFYDGLPMRSVYFYKKNLAYKEMPRRESEKEKEAKPPKKTHRLSVREVTLHVTTRSPIDNIRSGWTRARR